MFRAQKRLLIPIPNTDFDPTEVCVPWLHAQKPGIECIFATPDSSPGKTDPLMLQGLWFGLLGAKSRVVNLYRQMVQDPSFNRPLSYHEIVADDYDGLLLAGGHAPGMKVYLESEQLQQVAAQFLAQQKTVGAICHGPLVLARAKELDGRSLLRGRKVTGLPFILEWFAYLLTFWNLHPLRGKDPSVGHWLGHYYRTYAAYVEQEMRLAIGPEGGFVVGNLLVPQVVEDGCLLSARWPGDAELFAQTLCSRILS
jgi:putative intracellular protease/amidase